MGLLSTTSTTVTVVLAVLNTLQVVALAAIAAWSRRSAHGVSRINGQVSDALRTNVAVTSADERPDSPAA